MNKPFIKLFQTPNGFYFLDVNRNELVSITEGSFRFLSEAESDAQPGFPKTTELIELESQGYLAHGSAVDTVVHPYSEFLELFLTRKMSKIALQLTQNCNFRCKYCIYSDDSSVRQRSHSQQKMSWATAKKAVDFLWEHSIDSPDINIGFYGGEPLIEFPLMKQVVEYSKKKFYGKNLTFNITSNGTLLSDEIILYMQENNVSLLVSLDGPQEVNDLNRVFADGSGTYQAVIQRIERIREIAPELAKTLQISMVIDPQNDFDCTNTINLSEIVVDKMHIQPSLIDRGYDDRASDFSEDFAWRSEYQWFLAILAYFRRFPDEDVAPIAGNTLAKYITDFENFRETGVLHSSDAPSGPCIPGHSRMFVNVYEQLFPCERVSEKSPAMCLGTLDDGIDFEKAHQILKIGRAHV